MKEINPQVSAVSAETLQGTSELHGKGKRYGGKVNTRMLTVTAMLSAIAYVLMFLQIPVPLMPSFIKMDLSDFPALLAAFAYGPVAGVCVCLIKNLIHLMNTNTAGVGELSNFMLGALYVIPAGLIYKKARTKTTAMIGAAAGALAMALGSIVTNYFIVYPVYYNFMPPEAILGAYKAILPSVNSILECLLVFNLPFTFIKAVICTVIVFILYKPLSFILKGSNTVEE